MDAPVLYHFAIVLGDRDFAEGLAVNAFHVIGAKQVHVFVALGQFEGYVGNDHAQRKGLNTDLLVGVFTLSIQELQNIGMVGMQVRGTRTLTSPELISVAERVLEHLHNGHHPRGLVFNPLDRCTRFAQVSKTQCHAAAALRQLQGGVDAAGDRLHIVFHAHQEARD